MAKKIAQDAERRAMAAKVLAERKRTERRRSALILGACIVVVVGLLAAALIPYFKDKQDAEVVGTAIEKLGVTETAAHCDPVTEKSADGSGRKCCRSDVQAWGSSRKQTCVSDADALAQTAGHSAAIGHMRRRLCTSANRSLPIVEDSPTGETGHCNTPAHTAWGEVLRCDLRPLLPCLERHPALRTTGVGSKNSNQ